MQLQLQLQLNEMKKYTVIYGVGEAEGVEVIFVSRDRSQADMMESHADWLAVPFGSSASQLL